MQFIGALPKNEMNMDGPRPSHVRRSNRLINEKWTTFLLLSCCHPKHSITTDNTQHFMPLEFLGMSPTPLCDGGCLSRRVVG
jgi:hypothetical protein